MPRAKADAAGTRERLLDASSRVFLQEGVSRATLEQIVAAAGVTRGALYWHFSGKAEILQALVDRASLPHEELVSAVWRDSADAPRLPLVGKRCRRLLEILALDERRQQIFAILSLRCEGGGEGEALTRPLVVATDAMRGAVLDLLRGAAERGEMSQAWTPEAAAWSIHSAMVGLLNEWLRSARAFDLPNVGGATIDALLAAIADPARSPTSVTGEEP